METIISTVQWLGIFIALMMATRLVGSVLNEGKPETEHKKPNYKNISQMASNLVNSGVSTRKKIITELYEDPEWTEEEILELRKVLEGMLKTKIYLDKENKGLKSL